MIWIFTIFLIGLCCLDGKIYCIGGSYGSTGSKYCFRLDPESKSWERIADMHIGIVVDIYISNILESYIPMAQTSSGFEFQTVCTLKSVKIRIHIDL